MLPESPLWISQNLLTALGTKVFFHHQDRIPFDSRILLVSNHRSFMDAPLLMAAIERSVRFACHHYMGQVPGLREIVTHLGCFPLDAPGQRHQQFFSQATQLLQDRQVVGIFPEGASPMVQVSEPRQMREFHRGFAHLALRSNVPDLAVLPVAIVPQTETETPSIPLRLFSWFDPSEPLFQQTGRHPIVVYQRVDVLIGHPLWIGEQHRQDYQGKHARTVVHHLTEHCRWEIDQLLGYGT